MLPGHLCRIGADPNKLSTILKAIMVSILLIACSAAYSADITPPPRFPLEAAPVPTMKSAPASSLLLGDVKVIFDKTTLGEAMGQIKAGRIQHQGDAGESAYWLCYSNHTPTGWEQIWLLSHGEMGGDEHVIYGVAAKVTSSRPPASCPVLPNNLRPVELNNGIWLGTQKEEMRKKLGKPSLEQKDWLHYESRRELVGDPRAKDFRTDKIYERGSISVRAADGKVVELWATKQTAD